MTPNRFCYQFTISVLLLVSISSRYNIIPQLHKYAPKIADVRVKAAENKSPFDFITRNVDITESLITSRGVSPVGTGAYGKVFLGKFYTDMSEDFTQQAIKVVNLTEDFEDDPIGEQKMFRAEVIAHQTINQIDTNGYYFTKFFFCVDITAERIALYNASSTKNKTYVNETDKATFLYFTEKMDTDLYKYSKSVRDNQVKLFTTLERVKLGVHLTKGLQMISSRMEHCDIKPENIMLKKVSEQMVQAIEDNTVMLPKLGSDYYVAKYIDFGMVQFKKSNQKVKCPGGTKGYFGQEYFTTADASGIDMFALGMNLIDLEMTAHGFGMASDVLALSHDMRFRGVTKFSQKTINTVNSMSAAKAIFSVIDQVGLREKILPLALVEVPTLEQVLSKQGKTIFNCQNGGLAFLNIKLYEFMFRMGLENLPAYEPFHEMYNLDISNLERKLRPLQGKDDSKLVAMREKLELAMKVAILKKELSINYWNVLMGTIQPPATRLNYGELIGALKELIDHYDQALGALNSELEIGVEQIKQISASEMDPRVYKGTEVQRESDRQVQYKNENGLQQSMSQKFLV